MRYVAGGELLHAIAQIGSYGETEARLCFQQLLEGVAYIHSHNIAHRDLKLENLLLERPGDISRIRIVDFGLAKGKTGVSLLDMDTILGTPGYLAPEVVEV
jgi:serine/threonine protein kinase